MGQNMDAITDFCKPSKTRRPGGIGKDKFSTMHFHRLTSPPFLKRLARFVAEGVAGFSRRSGADAGRLKIFFRHQVQPGGWAFHDARSRTEIE